MSVILGCCADYMTAPEKAGLGVRVARPLPAFLVPLILIHRNKVPQQAFMRVAGLFLMGIS